MGRLGLDPLVLGTAQLRHQLADDIASDLVLNGKDIREIPIEPFGPDMDVVGRIDKLCRHPDAVPRFADAAFQYIANAQLFGDAPDVWRGTLVLKRRIASDDEERADTRLPGDDIFGQPVADKILASIARQVIERQHRNGGLVGQGWRRDGRLCPRALR